MKGYQYFLIYKGRQFLSKEIKRQDYKIASTEEEESLSKQWICMYPFEIFFNIQDKGTKNLLYHIRKQLKTV